MPVDAAAMMRRFDNRPSGVRGPIMKLAWAVSGQGMIARAVSEAAGAGLLASGIDLVIFDRIGPTDSMIEYCNRNGLAHEIIAPDDLERSMIELRTLHQLDWMGLTFNRLLSPPVITAFGGNIFNLHFSLLPEFPGFGATRKALQGNLPHTGVTVHLIDAGMDTGPVIAQKKVDIAPHDTVETLGRKQFEAAVPLAIQAVRNAGRGGLRPFSSTDGDIEAFARAFCERLSADHSPRRA
jgi:phosphoribosylglycinamide formyltransferase-1